MMNSPFVSVIIPNYNHASFLEERIQSVLNQTYQNFEIIILDDKSTDESGQIIERYQNNSHVSYIIINESNSGSPFSQWKKGIGLATGDLIWLAESDDACADTFLEELVTFYMEHNLVMAFTLSRKMALNGALGEIVQKDVSHDLIMDGHDYIARHISLITNASSAIFSSAYARNIDNNYFEYKGAGDWLFWTGIASHGNVGVLAKPLNYYRVHEKSTTSKLFSNGRDFFELNKIYTYLHKNGYWNSWTFLRNCAQMVYGIKYVFNFDNEDIRKSLMKEWNQAPLINQSYCLYKKSRSFLSKIKKWCC